MVSTGGKVAVGLGAAAVASIAIIAGLSKAAPAGKGMACTGSSSCPAGMICLNGVCTPAVLTLTALNATETPGESDTFTAHLTDASGTPIANYTVTLAEVLPDGTSGTPASSVTDPNGDAVFTVTFPGNAETGSYNFTASA